MLNIRAEFPHCRSVLFLNFLKEVQTMPGYSQKTDARGNITHVVDFTESTYRKLLTLFFVKLEQAFRGKYYVNGQQTRFALLWKRYLCVNTMEKLKCPNCGVLLSKVSLNTQFAMASDSKCDYHVLCVCGEEITDIITVARAITHSATPRELLEKFQGEA